MKRQLYVVLALMSVVGVAWSHGYQNNNGLNPHGINGRPHHPNSIIKPFSTNRAQINNNLYHGRFNNNRQTPNSVSNVYRHHEYPYSPYSVRTPHISGSPYTPYSTPNLDRTYSNAYALDLINKPYDVNIPYNLDNIANPYGIYGSPYSPNSATGFYSINPQQLYHGHRSYRGNHINSPYNASSVSVPYRAYNNPYFPGLINNR